MCTSFPGAAVPERMQEDGNNGWKKKRSFAETDSGRPDGSALLCWLRSISGDLSQRHQDPYRECVCRAGGISSGRCIWRPGRCCRSLNCRHHRRLCGFRTQNLYRQTGDRPGDRLCRAPARQAFREPQAGASFKMVCDCGCLWSGF